MTMNRSGGAAAKLPEERKALAVRALAGSEPITALADEEGVSRKFVYAQAGLANAALDEAFGSVAIRKFDVIGTLSVAAESHSHATCSVL
jgi:hypothetical protein